ncbi:hypothetical protein QLS71_003090 [Mariniflexile litorale]|uniref:AhpC/TSA family protein n=1 Tax=Mariniflexile litorale TaxID=3045158 RepID=A0AAU7EIP1_9FLAO|nr:hypothetical protein [Mariniflexile sp. KMM 9835]MDQ8210005.1 hypothetical protein [Mariniflexile sp. KMM 9835]
MKNIKILVILILIVFNGLLIYKLNLSNGAFVKTKELLKNQIIKNTDLIHTMKLDENNFLISKESEDLVLDKDVKLITLKGDTILAKEVFKQDNIVLRYSILNCKECIDAELNILINNNSSFSNEVCLIAYHINRRDMSVFYEELKKKGLTTNVKFFLTSNKGLKIPLENYEIPYYFHIDSNLKMNNFYIPNKDKPKLSEYYLKFGLKNHFHKNIKLD